VRGSRVSVVFTCVCVVVKKSEQKPCARGGKKSTNLRDRTPSADIDQSVST